MADDHIAIVPLQQEIRRRLQTPITLRVNSRPVFEVMTTVGQLIHVSVRAEPGAIASLSQTMQNNFSLSAKDQPAEQVLETIAAYTGLGYLIDPDGVVFFNAAAQDSRASTTSAAKPKPGSGSVDPFVGKIVVPVADGTTMEWLIRWSELPEDLRERRAGDLERAFRQLREKSAANSP